MQFATFWNVFENKTKGIKVRNNKTVVMKLE